MKVLFITSSRLGDAVLSTGLLNHIIRTHPGARITIVCGPLPASLFEGVPGLDQIITLKKQPWNRHWLQLWMKVASQHWDLVVDLRDSIVSRVILAGQRHIYSKHIDHTQHKLDQNAAVMGLSPTPAPTLWSTPAQQQEAKCLIPDGTPVLAIGPTANWRGKTWPADRFITLIEKLTSAGGLFANARVAIFAAPGEEKDAHAVLSSIPSERQIDLIAKTNPGTAAACLQRCTFFIGNDSGLMHCAAAAGIPTVGLFGPSWPHLYRPLGAHTDIAQTPETFAALTNFEGYDAKTCDTLMASLSVDSVLEAVSSLYSRCRPAL